MSRRNVSYNVAPRYSPGSPALVDQETALRVASEEKEHFEIAGSGAYGDGYKKLAEKLGLDGIVEERVERAGGWDVLDLITGRKLRRATVKARDLRVGDRILKIESGDSADRFTQLLPQTVLKLIWSEGSKSLSVIWDPVVGWGAAMFFTKTDRVKIERDTPVEP